MPSGGGYANICLNGNYCYAGGLNPNEGPHSGIIDVTYPNEPTLISTFDTSYYCSDMEVSGNCAYASWLIYGGLVLYDVSDPLRPLLASVDTTARFARGVFQIDDLIFLTNEFDIRIYNVTDPFQPHVVGVYDSMLSWAFYDVFVSGDFAYILDLRQLLVVDVTNPASPFFSGKIHQQPSFA
jgi:hypothetical protein